jgi:hypothetical protein
MIGKNQPIANRKQGSSRSRKSRGIDFENAGPLQDHLAGRAEQLVKLCGGNGALQQEKFHGQNLRVALG